MQHFSKDSIEIADCVPEKSPLAGIHSSDVMAFEIIRERDEILGLEADWRRLEASSPSIVMFQSFDWCQNYLDFCSEQKDASSLRPMVVVVKQGTKPVLILPLSLQNKGRTLVLTGLTEPFQQYSDILIDDECDPSLLRELLFKALRQCGGDYVHFGQVREDGKLATLLKGHVKASGEKDAAPFVALNTFENYQSYLGSIHSKTRKNLRNLKNRLERSAPVTHEVSRSGPLMEEVVARAYAGREAWLEEQGITSRAFRDDQFEAFLKRCGESQQDNRVDTIAMSLKHGNKVISDQWGFVYHGRYYAFMATWNPEYEHFSPGRLHLKEVIKTCFAEGFETADFMIPASSYKMTWAENAIPVCDYVIGVSLKGKLYSKIWLDLLRPLSKSIFFMLPKGLRGLLLKKVLPNVE